MAIAVKAKASVVVVMRISPWMMTRLKGRTAISAGDFCLNFSGVSAGAGAGVLIR